MAQQHHSVNTCVYVRWVDNLGHLGDMIFYPHFLIDTTRCRTTFMGRHINFPNQLVSNSCILYNRETKRFMNLDFLLDNSSRYVIMYDSETITLMLRHTNLASAVNDPRWPWQLQGQRYLSHICITTLYGSQILVRFHPTARNLWAKNRFDTSATNDLQMKGSTLSWVQIIYAMSDVTFYFSLCPHVTFY